jgi:hypothetical protein
VLDDGIDRHQMKLGLVGIRVVNGQESGIKPKVLRELWIPQ